MQVFGPYMNLKQAARYLGYHPDTFRRKLRDYDIPRYGPEGNKFAQSVLDLFMQDPDNFKKGKQYQRKKNVKTTVSV